MNTANTLLARAGLVLAGLLLLTSCGGGDDGGFYAPIVVSDADANAAQRPQVTFNITNGAGVTGQLVITLVPEHAPKTVANFLAYVQSGFYVGTIIHRNQAGFVLQGGGYQSPVATTDTPTHKATNAPIELEVKVSNVLGTVAMARTSAPNSATSEFFINLGNNSALDYSGGGYAAFGYISNLTLVNAMTQAPCEPWAFLGTGANSLGCLPVPNLVITAAAQTR
jgi:peptidyl-prolyl cis-trans isomerase A (cyclophilin A)